MTILVLILVALGVFSAVLGLLSHKTGNNEDTIVRADTASCATCSGEDKRCEQTCMMEAYIKDITMMKNWMFFKAELQKIIQTKRQSSLLKCYTQ